MSETTYNLYALCQGSRACDASWLLYLSESGRTRTLPYFFWALTPEGGGRPIVIDTGFSEDAQKARNPDYADYRPQHELLKHFDLKPSQVETMIVSHLHWDHFASPRLFTGARFYLQRRELDFWRSDAAEYHFINHFLGDLEEAEKLLEAGRMELVDGEAEIADGVHVHWTGGHTPGHQIVRFRTARGWAVLAVDAAYLYRSLESMIPPGIPRPRGRRPARPGGREGPRRRPRPHLRRPRRDGPEKEGGVSGGEVVCVSGVGLPRGRPILKGLLKKSLTG